MCILAVTANDCNATKPNSFYRLLATFSWFVALQTKALFSSYLLLTLILVILVSHNAYHMHTQLMLALDLYRQCHDAQYEIQFVLVNNCLCYIHVLVTYSNTFWVKQKHAALAIIVAMAIIFYYTHNNYIHLDGDVLVCQSVCMFVSLCIQSLLTWMG